MPDPTLEEVLLRKATSIAPDKNAQWYTDNPVKGGALDIAAGGALDPHNEIGLADVLTAALPFAGKALKAAELPMDVASRMRRAREMGYTRNVFHGARDRWPSPHWVNGDIKEFSFMRPPFGDAGIHVAPNPQVADEAVRIGLWDNPQYAHHANIMPLKARIQNPLELPDMGTWKSPYHWSSVLNWIDANTGESYMERMARAKPQDAKVLRELADAAYEAEKGTATNDEAWANTFRDTLKRNGYDSIKYKNTYEGQGKLSYMLLDPNQLRSKFAKFDPSQAHSGNILASLLAGIGLGTAATQQDK